MIEEPEDSEPDETRLSDGATPACPHCLAPISPRDDYCSHCGEAVGQLTGIIPFVNICFQTNFYGKLWRKVWSDEGVGILTVAVCLLCIIVLAPVMFVGCRLQSGMLSEPEGDAEPPLPVLAARMPLRRRAR